jgi:hypothetical protein
MSMASLVTSPLVLTGPADRHAAAVLPLELLLLCLASIHVKGTTLLDQSRFVLA